MNLYLNDSPFACPHLVWFSVRLINSSYVDVYENIKIDAI